MILYSFVSQKYLCCRKFSVQQGHVNNHTSIREGDVRVGTNSTEHPQLNTLHRNKLLSLSKLHNNSSSISLSCVASSFNSIYKPLTSSFVSNISESRVIGMDNKVDVCDDNVVSTPQLPSQFIQTQLTQKNIPQISTHTQPTKYISIPLKQPTTYISIPLNQPTQSIKTPLKQPTPSINIPLKQTNTYQLLSSSSLPHHFHCITNVGFTYHYPLYATFDHWIQSIFPLLRLLMHSSQLNYIFLFCRKYLSVAYPLDPFIVSLHNICLT